MHDGDDGYHVSRRTLLRASAGTATLSAVGSVRADGDDGATGTTRWFDGDCPEATLEPGMTHCEGASAEGCADDHPATTELRSAVRDTLETGYPDAETLLEAGYEPYFDTLETGDDSWSHWLSPEFIGDGELLDPERPESVLVDNRSWRSIGVMFIATLDGDPIDPPAVYGAETSEAQCSPWHAHTGLPGRFAWWYYRQVYEQGFRHGELELPCRTPCMLHVWTVDHPESVYAHDAPPREYRDLAPADDPDFDTDAVPGEDALGWDALPDEALPERLPGDFAMADRFGIDLGL
ncbi:hypothetical protein [Natrinema salsiterrestre]|uniref:Uncharacterized protein n=1 Tax=Natrinema salsiterrestre TaxID=2950540 RepID=A0A9Q4L543_9EURY|nr:hypothetical protein [Natrinema salsiterrestre]MDF9745451.1 hypothetical protein [Natrinema salsiterrestre]